jgi:hypothetical protein
LNWPLYCLSIFNLRLLTTTFVSSNFSFLATLYTVSEHCQCLEKVNVKYVINRLWYDIFHIVPGISPRPISAIQFRCRAWYEICGLITMTLESVCKIYPRRWHLNGNFYSTRRIHIWANYSVSSSLNFIPVFWNVLIWYICKMNKGYFLQDLISQFVSSKICNIKVNAWKKSMWNMW